MEREHRSLEEHAEDFLESLKRKGFSGGTIRNRRQHLNFFLRYCEKKHLRYPTDATEEKIARYLRDLREGYGGRTYSPDNIRTKLVVLRVFFRYLVRQGSVLYDPAAHFAMPRSPERIARHVPGETELELIIASVDTEDPVGLRDRCMMELLYATALRRSELCDLVISDADTSAGILRVRHGKGGKERYVPLGERATHWIGRYLTDSRSRLARRRSGEYLFVNREGGKMTPWTLSSLVGEYVRKKSERPGACHLFRHACATHMLEGGADIRYIQELLGHSSIDTTKIYTQVSARHLREVHRKSHPEPAHEPECERIGKRKPGRRVFHTKSVSPSDEKKQPQTDISGSLTKYLEDLDLRGGARASVNCARIAVSRFFRFCITEGIDRIEHVTPDVIGSYERSLLEHRKRNGEALSIVSRYGLLKELRLFCVWLKKTGILPVCPADALELPKKPRKLPGDHLSFDEAERTLAQPDVDAPYGLRDRVILEILYATGIRRTELVGLRLSDLDFEKRLIRVEAAKQGRSRNVPAGERAFFWINRYVRDIRPELVRGEDPGDLFIVSHGQRICADFVTQLCRKYLRLAGIEKRGASHIFRHTCATLMLEGGADIRSLQEFLGHRHLTSTQLYTHVSIKKLREIHAATHPGEKRFLEKRRRMEEEKNPGAHFPGETGGAA